MAPGCDERAGAVFEVTAPLAGPGPFSIHGRLADGTELDFGKDAVVGLGTL